MSSIKAALGVTPLILAVIMALTFFVKGNNPGIICFYSDTGISGGVEPTTARGNARYSSYDGPPIKATVRGFPLWYYQEPLPPRCAPVNDQVSPSSFNGAHFADDLLLWLPVSFLVALMITKIRARK